MESMRYFNYMREELLEKVYKPARYLGNEWNVSEKDLNSTYLKIALCFPDVYEVGMSHLGFRIIYGLLNEIEDVACERVFNPDKDLEELLVNNNIRLTSLESNVPLLKFDIVGFSLSYELSFVNVLNMLGLSSIPLRAEERNDKHPLIIAGGYSCINPEPMADFIDCFLIGEAEESVLELVDKVRSAKLENKDRKQLLRELSCVEGIYVPSLYRVEYNTNGTIRRFIHKDNIIPSKVKKRIVKDLDSSFYPTRWVVPYMQIVHDRITLEIMRGCPNNCRFCQARSFYHPYRKRCKKQIVKLAGQLLGSSGYEEFSLLGLSCGDYPEIQQILTHLISVYKDKGIGISLPSLKIKNCITDIPMLLKGIKKTGLTFAPEAGSERLRRIINKNIDIKELFNVVENAYRAGYQHVKLYFMIGLPSERLEDIEEIADLAVRMVSLRKNIDSKLGKLTLSISAFNPKPHTYFERLAMDKIEELNKKKNYLLSKVKEYAVRNGNSDINRAIKIDFHDSQKSLIEAALSRADRKIGEVIYNAFRLGAGVDSGKSRFDFGIWRRAFQQAGIDPYFYTNRKIALSEILPWSHIDIGI